MARAWYSSELVRKASLGLGSFLGFLLIIWLLGKIPAVGNVFARVEAGAVRLGTGIGKTISRVTQSEASLSVQFQACQDNLRLSSIASAQLASLTQETNELRALLAYTEKTGAAGITTQVIARAIDGDATRVIIDKGSLDGLVAGSAAVIDDGVLFGLIETVHEQTAVVRLVANATSKLPATVLGEQRTLGLVEGREGALLVMEFIPQDAKLKTGDLVVTSGLDGLVQDGLVIGLVTEVVTVESAPFQKAFVELLYEPREWTTLLVLPPPGL